MVKIKVFYNRKIHLPNSYETFAVGIEQDVEVDDTVAGKYEAITDLKNLVECWIRDNIKTIQPSKTWREK